ncbi:MAG: ABC transporter ATP-binding protein [Gammaproteobacteria bacterium]|nr:MAG: ABC transporter ATP-binding protein [Gammaproteobacteria bacterium]TLZ00906.1 MAG: ABC transporter ATP-binding protein [Gammaproteobacteria bacterium]TLZ06598.1 MAG: ABC transporter ATP-binding protein [Gammaproteobacteria bacterium]TLZ29080.1 MAG: ABC transporter ATP-binding protein [Gammaproteobacteria bacterium]
MIKTEQLTKRYDSLTAVDDVSFHVGPGEVLGFLGPNGAGKTTTMRMLAGFVTPTSGRASICGHDVESEPLKAKAALGYLPEGAPLYGEMTVRRFLEFIADLRSLTGARRSQRLGHVIEHLQLGGVLDQTIETLSKGFRRRVGLAQAIMHDPPVLILDEPTDGLDPNQKHEVRTLINDMARDKIIVISTHILEEVDAVCTRAIIISRGRIVADDTPTGLAARSRYHNAVSMQLEQPAQLAAARAAVAALPAVAEVEVSERDARLTALPRAGATILPAVSELAVRAGLKLKELHLESGRLDEVFRTITA